MGTIICNPEENMKVICAILAAAVAVASAATVPTSLQEKRISQDLHKLMADIEASDELPDKVKTDAEEKIIGFRHSLEKERVPFWDSLFGSSDPCPGQVKYDDCVGDRYVYVGGGGQVGPTFCCEMGKDDSDPDALRRTPRQDQIPYGQCIRYC